MTRELDIMLSLVDKGKKKFYNLNILSSKFEIRVRKFQSRFRFINGVLDVIAVFKYCEIHMFIQVHTNVMFEDLRKYDKKCLKNIFQEISVNPIRMWEEMCAQLGGEIRKL